MHYEKMDKRCRGLVMAFNKVGLKTEFCCSGHYPCSTYYILFSSEVTDDDIRAFLNKLNEKDVLLSGDLVKWIRGNPIMENWMYQFVNGSLWASGRHVNIEMSDLLVIQKVFKK